jgi:hypothetical protein
VHLNSQEDMQGDEEDQTLFHDDPANQAVETFIRSGKLLKDMNPPNLHTYDLKSTSSLRQIKNELSLTSDSQS